MTKTVSETGLHALATAILENACGNGDIASKVARRLVDANMTGHDSHGVGVLPGYVAALRAGELQPDGAAEMVLSD